MPENISTISRIRRGARHIALVALFTGGAVACTGPDTGDDRDPTPTATTTATATQVPPTETPSATPTEPATPTSEPTATTSASPTVASTPTAAASPTPEVVELRERLPRLVELPGQGYSIAEEGTRTAQELANAYEDSAAHLRRLEEWGFKQHLFRSFTRDGGENDPLPYLILSTINEYGSDEQAENALQWLRQLGTATGATTVDAPNIGNNAVALTVPTREGVPTASIYVREGPVLFVYFAEGGDPLPAVEQISTAVFER